MTALEDITAGGRLLFGMAGWPLASRDAGYFPDDLPEDWRFAYYSNEADCLMLQPDQWSGMTVDDWEAWLEDVPDHFRFFLRIGEQFPKPEILALLGSYLGGLLSEGQPAAAPAWPLFVQEQAGVWCHASSGHKAVMLAAPPGDLRALRGALEALPPGVRAIFVADPAAVPGKLADTRKVAELLGIA